MIITNKNYHFPTRNNFIKNACLIIFFYSIVFGCGDKTPTFTPVKVFSLTIQPGYVFKKDNWVMIHNSSGALLDSKQFSTPGTITLQASIPVTDDKVNVTLFSYDSMLVGSGSGSYTYKEYLIESNLAIPTGQEWTLLAPKIPVVTNPGTLNGHFYANYTDPDNVRMEMFGNGTTLASTSSSGNQRQATLPIYNNKNDFLLSVAGDGNPRYKYYEHVTDGQTASTTFDQMSEYDHILTISFPASQDPYIAVRGDDVTNGSTFYTYFNGFNVPPFAPTATRTSFKIGYLNRFTNYNSYFQINTPGFDFSYTNNGTIPADITVPDHDIYKVTDNTFLGFSYTNEKPFNIRRTQFVQSSGTGMFVSWTLSSPDGSSKITELPADLVKKYPFLDFTKFKYVATDFITSSYSYADDVNSRYKGIALPQNFEKTEISPN